MTGWPVRYRYSPPCTLLDDGPSLLECVPKQGRAKTSRIDRRVHVMTVPKRVRVQKQLEQTAKKTAKRAPSTEIEYANRECYRVTVL